MNNNEICQLPCRTNQLNFLSSLFKNSIECCFPSLFIYGHTSTGKTSVIMHVLQKLKCRLVSVNCIECYSPRLLFESILQQIDENYNSKCLNTYQFINQLKDTFIDLNIKCLYILFENAEKLRDSPLILGALLRLNELSRLNIGVILESEIVWEKFRSGTGYKEPFVYHFPDYSKEELCSIMMLDCPSDCPQKTYSNYIQLLVNLVFYACRDLNELRYLALMNFPSYIEPVTKGEASFEDTHKLWKNAEPLLKNTLKGIHLKTLASSSVTQRKSVLTTTSKYNIELPVYTKFLLMAAYIASYNPPITDRRFFTKHGGKLNKRRLETAKNKQERTNNHLLGPKYFPMDRLMAIFYSIMDDKVPPSSNTFIQITSLVSLGLLSRNSSSDLIESPKYRCLVSLDFIQAIAKSVEFEIVRYLFDFV